MFQTHGNRAQNASLQVLSLLLFIFIACVIVNMSQLAYAGVRHTLVGNLSVSQNLSVANNAFFDTAVAVGNSDPQAMVDISGNVSLGDNVSVADLLQVGGYENGGIITFGNGETIDNLVNGRITITANLSVTGNSYTEGTITTNNAQGGATKSVFDFAEAIEGKDLEDGDVIVIGDDYTFEKATAGYDPNVVGVISDSHAVLAGVVDYESKFPLSMAGIVYVKVTGDVKRGQLLVSSDEIEGAAMVSDEYKVGTVIGKALEDRATDDAEKTKIKMLVMNL